MNSTVNNVVRVGSIQSFFLKQWWWNKMHLCLYLEFWKALILYALNGIGCF